MAHLLGERGLADTGLSGDQSRRRSPRVERLPKKRELAVFLAPSDELQRQPLVAGRGLEGSLFELPEAGACWFQPLLTRWIFRQGQLCVR